MSILTDSSGNILTDGSGNILTNFANPAVQTGAKIYFDASLEKPAENTAKASIFDYTLNSNTAAQASGTKQPLWKTDATAGRVAYFFDGSNDAVTMPVALGKNVASMALVMHQRNLAQTTTQALFNLSIASGLGSRFELYVLSTGVYGAAMRRLDADTLISQTTAIDNRTGGDVLTIVWDGTAGLFYLRQNGVQRAVIATATGSTSNTNSGASSNTVSGTWNGTTELIPASMYLYRLAYLEGAINWDSILGIEENFLNT